MANVSNLKTLKAALHKHPALLVDTLCKFVNKDVEKSQVLGVRKTVKYHSWSQPVNVGR